MNAVGIEEAVSALAKGPFDQAGFPYPFLEAFGNKKATIDKLKKGDANKSNIERGFLLQNNIHIVICTRGDVSKTLVAESRRLTAPDHRVREGLPARAGLCCFNSERRR